MRIWLIEFGFGMFIAMIGMVAGWWLRGRSRPTATRTAKTDRKDLAEQCLQGLHAATETVRCCVQEHIDCIHAIETELRDSSATEPAVISGVADSIIAANGLVQHKFDDIQRMIDSKQDELQDHLSDPYGLLTTFASLDRQKHVYRQVLRSLELLATELTDNINGHGQRLQDISNQLEEAGRDDVAGVTAAVGQIEEAANDFQQQVDAADERICEQADKVEMQAILSHVDLLTSLPNRRALDAELEQAAARSRGRAASFTLLLIDLDHLKQVNDQYGHAGGDLILRQAAGIIKQMVRGKDMVARYRGDTYAVMLHKMSLHDALPIAERIRGTLEQAEFSHGNFPLRVTSSIGIAHLEPEEKSQALTARTEAALHAAQQAGGNLCFWHDGDSCNPVSSAFKHIPDESTKSLAAMFRKSITGDEVTEPQDVEQESEERAATLSGRSLFVANVQRRMAEWKRGGPPLSVIVLKVDQMQPLVAKFGDSAQSFLHQVMARLLEAVTREMDERCEFEDGVFAVLLPGLDEANAVAVAERLQSQVRQTKVRVGDALWNITSSIGAAHCSLGTTVVEVMRSADSAMKLASQRGGDAICIGQNAAAQPQGVIG